VAGQRDWTTADSDDNGIHTPTLCTMEEKLRGSIPNGLAKRHACVLDLERYVQAEVSKGHFASEEDAITQAVRPLRQRGQEPQAQAMPLSEDEWERRLLQSGLLASIPPRPSDVGARRAFQPIRIQGEPLSETVIRERR
jgi:Arc/MetJ-type ribon-helix-helix transcriptional regulator